jgi:hypothetical protein
MAPIKVGRGTVAARRAWEPPAMTQLAIGAETKSARQESPGFDEPPPPTPPAAKFGFSFELSMPLAARAEK